MPAISVHAANQHNTPNRVINKTTDCREYDPDLASAPRVAPAASMLHRRLLILGYVTVAATVGLLCLEILPFSRMSSHFGIANDYRAKDNATLKENRMSLDRHVELNLNSSITASRSPTTAAATSTAATASRPTTTSPPPSSVAFLLNNPNVACFTSNGGHGTDGFGSQFHYLLAGIAIAHHAGINFAWVPFYVMDHKANVSQMEEFAGAANAFRHRDTLGTFAHHADHQPTLETIQNFKHRPECSSGNAPYMWYINDPKSVLDGNPGMWVKSRDVMRRAYLSTPKPNVTKYFMGGAGVKHVVMFQRRYIKAFDNRGHDLLPNEYYLAIMQRLRVAHNSVQFYLLSLSNMSQPCGGKGEYTLCNEQFEDFDGIADLTMLLDLPLMDAFHVMVSADILVDSMSSFSYAAAVLTLGEVYHHGGHHSLVPGHLLLSPIMRTFVFSALTI